MKKVWMLTMAVALPALATTRDDAVKDALRQARSAQAEVEDAAGPCRKKVAGRVDALVDSLEQLRSGATEGALRSARKKAEALVDAAGDACRGSTARRIGQPLEKVVASLEAAESASDVAPTASSGGGTILGINVNLAGGLGGLLGGGSSTTTGSHTETRTTRRTETVNGRPVDGDDGAPAPAAAPQRTGAAFGATCTRNSDCESNTCFVGAGTLGYCTKMCDSWSACPSFWECKKASNAPQRICMQDKE